MITRQLGFYRWTRWSALLGVFTAFPITAAAQNTKPAITGETPRYEIFGGFGFSRFDLLGSQANNKGWEGSAAFNLVPRLGIEADASGDYSSPKAGSITLYSNLFGPKYNFGRAGSGTTPFVHALFGAARLNLTPPGTSSIIRSEFAMKLGGGLDFNLYRFLAVRAVEVDYVRYSFFHQHQNGFRIAGGVVFRLGRL